MWMVAWAQGARCRDTAATLVGWRGEDEAEERSAAQGMYRIVVERAHRRKYGRDLSARRRKSSDVMYEGCNPRGGGGGNVLHPVHRACLAQVSCRLRRRP